MHKTIAAALLLPLCLASCGDEDDAAPEGAWLGDNAPLATKINAATRAVIPEEPGKNWVFDAYATANSPDAAWSRFWTKAIDFSGVAWDKPQTLTMVSPRHAVMARHYQRPPKARTVVFHDRRGKEVRRTIVGGEFLTTDIAVVVLDREVPDTVKIYPVLAPSESYKAELPGAYALVTDRERKVHVHEIAALAGAGISFKKADSLPEGFHEPLIAGDSGNPTFVLVRGEPVLIETHSLGGSGAGPFYSAPKNIAEINAAMAELSIAYGGPQYQLRTVSP